MIDEAGGLDIGRYKCVARNSLGTDTLTRNLGIIVKASVSVQRTKAPLELSPNGGRGCYHGNLAKLRHVKCKNSELEN